LAAGVGGSRVRAVGSGGPKVAVVDRVGTIVVVLRRACPGISFRAVRSRRELASDDRLAILAAYAHVDWDTLAPLARRSPTVVIAAVRGGGDAERAMSAGAFGYLDLEVGPAALRRAVLGALRGEPAYSRAAFGQHLRSKLESTVLGASRARELTPRQREVVALIASGHSDKEIATALGIATATAQKHVTNVLRRLKVPNRAAAAVAVVQIALAVTTWPAGD
jgi:DNA-binding NarL/FixJ family response regulator